MLSPETIVGLKTDLSDWKKAFEAMESGKLVKSVLIPETSDE